MIIELYGLPGSGKTTLANKLAAEKGYAIIKVRKKRELVYYNLFFLFKHPYKFVILLFYVIINSNNPRLFYYKFMNTFLGYNAKYQKAKRYENAILDQGYFLNAFALFERPIEKAEMKKYFKHILKPDQLLILDIPFEVSLERTKERGYFARENFGEEYKKEWQKAVWENNQLFLNIVEDLEINYKKIIG